MKLLYFISFINLFLVIQSCKKIETKTNTPPPAPIVDIIIAKQQNIISEIEANGSIIAKEYVELHPEVSGRLIYLDVPEGNTVEQGQIIAKINNADLLAQLSKAKSQLKLAQKQEQRLAQLLSINGINQSDYDAAENQVNSLKADISYTNALIDKTIVKAPFSGVVGLRQVSPGAYVTPNNIIASIQQLSALKVDFTVPEIHVSILQKGLEVEVQLDKIGDRKKAVITAIEPQANPTTRNLKVRALLKEGKANPGSFVKVYLNVGRDKQSIFVPTSAVIPEDKFKTLIVVKDGKAIFTKIETGERQAGGIEVTSGIAEGDSVVVTGILFVRPDVALKVRSVKQLEEVIK